jgi:hypothetical protein
LFSPFITSRQSYGAGPVSTELGPELVTVDAGAQTILLEDDNQDHDLVPRNPSLSDVLLVRSYLLQYTCLPAEIINIILDYASYWASATFQLDYPVQATGSTPFDDVLILRTIPLGLSHEENLDGSLHIHGPTKSEVATWAPPRGQNPFRKVEFRISSHDQGWCSFIDPNWGPYDGSSTWFEAYIEHTLIQQSDCSLLRVASENTIQSGGFQWTNEHRTMSPSWIHPSGVALACPSYRPHLPMDNNTPTFLARNLRGNLTLQHHRVVWHYLDDIGAQSDVDPVTGLNSGGGTSVMLNGSFVRELKIGDTIAVWAKARHPRWVNYIHNASVTVSWAI